LRNGEVLEKLSKKLRALPPEHLPTTDDQVWKPAIEVVGGLIDILVELALCKAN
jgi:hypothetical protein